ncbi:MAG: hypothetical protein AAFY64_10610, partial [Pseudomonadota bacterium]
MARRARRRAQASVGSDEAAEPAWVRRHLNALELRYWDYNSWCRDHGFSAGFEKSRKDRDAELTVRTRERDAQRAADRESARVHNNPRRLIQELCDGAVLSSSIRRSEWRTFCERIESTDIDQDYRESLKDFLLAVLARSDFLTETTETSDGTALYVDGLIKLHDRRGQWRRSIGDWRPRSHNDRRRFGSLARHLLCAYDVPRFMDEAWLRRDPGSWRFRDWFVHIGQGHNIRTASTPIPLTKKMAHAFLKAPDDYGIEQALRYGQVTSLGGDRRLCDAVLGTKLGQSFENDDFWASVLRWFIA